MLAGLGIGRLHTGFVSESHNQKYTKEELAVGCGIEAPMLDPPPLHLPLCLSLFCSVVVSVVVSKR